MGRQLVAKPSLRPTETELLGMLVVVASQMNDVLKELLQLRPKKRAK
jgi:hypothetical protein